MSIRLIGLCGAHRTGKSTLTEQVAIQGNRRIIDISISEMQKQLGYDSSNQEYDWETRKFIQSGLLSIFSTQLEMTQINSAQLRSIEYCITERTPLDLIGYLLINAPKEPTEEDNKWINAYIRDCIKLTNKYYDGVYLVQPGIPYVDVAKSAKEDLIEPLNSVYLSVSLNKDLNIDMHVIPREITSLEDRVFFVLGVNKNVS